MLCMDSSLVRYMSLDRVITQEGGRHNPANIKAAYGYLKSPKTLGLLRYNNLTRRTDIGYIEVSKRNDFMEKWERVTTHTKSAHKA
jgi:hypothetical protein